MKSARVSTPASPVPSLGDGLGYPLQTYDKNTDDRLETLRVRAEALSPAPVDAPSTAIEPAADRFAEDPFRADLAPSTPHPSEATGASATSHVTAAAAQQALERLFGSDALDSLSALHAFAAADPVVEQAAFQSTPESEQSVALPSSNDASFALHAFATLDGSPTIVDAPAEWSFADPAHVVIAEMPAQPLTEMNLGESWVEEIESSELLQPYWSSNVGASALDSPSSGGAARRVDADAFLAAVNESVPTTVHVTGAPSSPWAWDLESAELGSDSPFVSAFDHGPTDASLPDERAGRAARAASRGESPRTTQAGEGRSTDPPSRVEKRELVVRELSFIAQEEPSGPMNFRAILVIVVVALTFGAGGAWWWMSKNTAEPSTARELKAADFAAQTAPAASPAPSSAPTSSGKRGASVSGKGSLEMVVTANTPSRVSVQP